jgi:hypothetical protein
MTYTYKVWPELAWAVFVGAVVVLGTELVTFDVAVLNDPTAWLAGLLGAVARAVGAAILSVFKPGPSAQG